MSINVFKLLIKGKESEQIEITKNEAISSVEFILDSPDDVESKSSKMNATLVIKGKIISELYMETKKICDWATLSTSSSEINRDVIVNKVYDGKIVREIHFPNAFVVDYKENFGEDEETGVFELKIRQKREKLDKIEIKTGEKVNQKA